MDIIDLHCDTISVIFEKKENLYSNSGHFDILRASEAGMVLQFFALFTMPGDRNSVLRHTLMLAEKYLSQLDKYNNYLYPVKTAGDINNSTENHKIGCLLHLEGAECLGKDIAVLEILYRLGLRSIGLTWNHRNLLADGIGENNGGGISDKGKEMIQAMDQMGIMLDLAHISEKAYFEALEHYNRPVIISHANARQLCPHRRNLTDEQLRALARHGGVVGVNQVADFVALEKPSLDKFIDHIIYISELIGVEHVALGSDFDGADDIVLKGVQDYKKLPEKMRERGFSEDEIRKILSENAGQTIKRII
jgi:membrane dipeptidase